MLRRAQLGDAPEDFKNAAATTIEFWSGLRAQSGEMLEVHQAGSLLRPVLVSLDGGDLRLDAVTTPFASGAPLRRSRLVGLSDGNHDDVRVSVTGHGNHAYFAEEHDGRTRLRKLTLRWSR